MFFFKGQKQQQGGGKGNGKSSSSSTRKSSSWFGGSSNGNNNGNGSSNKHNSNQQQQQQQRPNRTSSMQRRNHATNNHSFEYANHSSNNNNTNNHRLGIAASPHHDDSRYYNHRNAATTKHRHTPSYDDSHYADDDYRYYQNDDNNSLDTSLYTSRSRSTIQYQHHTISSIGGPSIGGDDSTLGTNGAYNTDVVHVLHARSLGMQDSPSSSSGKENRRNGHRYGRGHGGGDSNAKKESVPKIASTPSRSREEFSARLPATGTPAGKPATSAATTKHAIPSKKHNNADDDDDEKISTNHDSDQDLSVPDLNVDTTTKPTKTTISPNTNTKTATTVDKFSVNYVMKQASQMMIQQTPSNITATTATNSSSASASANNNEVASKKRAPHHRQPPKFDLAYWQAMQHQQKSTAVVDQVAVAKPETKPFDEGDDDDDDDDAAYTGPIDLDETLDGSYDAKEPKLDSILSENKSSSHSDHDSSTTAPSKPNSEATLKASNNNNSKVTSLAKHYESSLQQKQSKNHRRTLTPPNLPKSQQQRNLHATTTSSSPAKKNKLPQIQERSAAAGGGANHNTPFHMMQAAQIHALANALPDKKPKYNHPVASEHSRDSSTLWQFSPQNSQHTRDESVTKLLMPVTDNKKQAVPTVTEEDIPPLPPKDAATVTSASSVPTQQIDPHSLYQMMYSGGTLPQPTESPRSLDDSLLHSSIESSSVYWDMSSHHQSPDHPHQQRNGQALLVPRPMLDREMSEGASSLENSSIFQFSPQSTGTNVMPSPQRQQQSVGKPKMFIGAMYPKSLLESFSGEQRNGQADDEFSVASIEEWSNHLKQVQPSLRPPPPPPPEAMPMPSFGENSYAKVAATPKQPQPNNRTVSPAMAKAIMTLHKHKSPEQRIVTPKPVSAARPQQHPWSMPQSKYFMMTPDSRRSSPCPDGPAQTPSPIVSPQTPHTPSLVGPTNDRHMVTPNPDQSLMDQDTTTTATHTEASEGYISFALHNDASNEWSQYSSDDTSTQTSPSIFMKNFKTTAADFAGGGRPEHFAVQGGPVGENRMMIQQDDALSDVSSTIHKRIVTDKGETILITSEMLAKATRLLDMAGCINPDPNKNLLESEFEYHDRDDEQFLPHMNHNVHAVQQPQQQSIIPPPPPPLREQSTNIPARDDSMKGGSHSPQQQQPSQEGSDSNEDIAIHADDSSTSSEESTGAILLTKTELERHMKKQEGSKNLPVRHFVSADDVQSNSNGLAGYEQWKLERERSILQLKKLAKQQAKAEKKVLKRREEVGGEDVHQSKMAPVTPKPDVRHPSESSPTATNTSFAPSTPSHKNKSPPKKKKKDKTGGGKRRWLIFGKRKNKSKAKSNGNATNDAAGEENGADGRALQLAEFMSIASSHKEIEEPTEVAELSLAPLNTIARQLGGAVNNMEDDNRTSFLAQQYLERERRKEQEAVAEKEQLEEKESERIQRRKEAALIEARRKEASRSVTSSPSSSYKRGVPYQTTNSLGEQLSVIDSISSKEAADTGEPARPTIPSLPTQARVTQRRRSLARQGNPSEAACFLHRAPSAKHRSAPTSPCHACTTPSARNASKRCTSTARIFVRSVRFPMLHLPEFCCISNILI
eukprot:CAMPEP_0119545708 /NCGR_PEP_ID=MMETSP1352-20130426/381_1 /TAXON_ID=265584 /ORGANISM="Stauroneis constricta, Strain CCMP1120" /LENGTH=1604 /DNA_ID=CAMNT_0007590295 /DNA_START=210 /DNA_END=5025 /DNA_ORIENTATION=-